MTSAPEPAPSVGQQLKSRREELDKTQGALAGDVGVTVNAISNAERDQSQISRSKRPLWERSLRLRPGTISRAYATGTPVEPVDDDTPAAAGDDEDQVPAEVDLDDRHERSVWEETTLSREDRLEMIRAWKIAKGKRHRGGGSGQRLA